MTVLRVSRSCGRLRVRVRNAMLGVVNGMRGAGDLVQDLEWRDECFLEVGSLEGYGRP